MSIFFLPGLSGLSGSSRWRKLAADPDLAIDLGTANTRLYVSGRGLIADEPSIVKMPDRTRLTKAIGAQAAKLSRPEASAQMVSPLRAGVVADVDAATSLLTPLLRRARRFGLIHPRALACVPTNASDEERAAVVEATRRAGAAAVALAPEPLAAAIGAGLDVGSRYAHMLVDIGDGVTDIAVIRSGELVMTAAVRTACSDLHRAVRQMVAERHGVHLYAREAERLTCRLGAASGDAPAASLIAAGIDCATSGETTIWVSSHEVSEAIAPVIETIVWVVRAAVKDLPANLACEVIESGISLTGGGACLAGMADLIAAETAIDVRPADDPLHAVINGARQMLSVGIATNLWLT
jgi:rod shape-determining protein MreB